METLSPQQSPPIISSSEQRTPSPSPSPSPDQPKATRNPKYRKSSQWLSLTDVTASDSDSQQTGGTQSAAESVVDEVLDSDFETGNEILSDNVIRTEKDRKSLTASHQATPASDFEHADSVLTSSPIDPDSGSDFEIEDVDALFNTVRKPVKQPQPEESRSARRSTSPYSGENSIVLSQSPPSSFQPAKKPKINKAVRSESDMLFQKLQKVRQSEGKVDHVHEKQMRQAEADLALRNQIREQLAPSAQNDEEYISRIVQDIKTHGEDHVKQFYFFKTTEQNNTRENVFRVYDEPPNLFDKLLLKDEATQCRVLSLMDHDRFELWADGLSSPGVVQIFRNFLWCQNSELLDLYTQALQQRSSDIHIADAEAESVQFFAQLTGNETAVTAARTDECSMQELRTMNNRAELRSVRLLIHQAKCFFAIMHTALVSEPFNPQFFRFSCKMLFYIAHDYTVRNHKVADEMADLMETVLTKPFERDADAGNGFDPIIVAALVLFQCTRDLEIIYHIIQQVPVGRSRTLLVFRSVVGMLAFSGFGEDNEKHLIELTHCLQHLCVGSRRGNPSSQRKCSGNSALLESQGDVNSDKRIDAENDHHNDETPRIFNVCYKWILHVLVPLSRQTLDEEMNYKDLAFKFLMVGYLLQDMVEPWNSSGGNNVSTGDTTPGRHTKQLHRRLDEETVSQLQEVLSVLTNISYSFRYENYDEPYIILAKKYLTMIEARIKGVLEQRGEGDAYKAFKAVFTDYDSPVQGKWD